MSETVFAPAACALCGRDPAAGFASVGDDWYCHGDFDPEPTCYMRAQAAMVDPAALERLVPSDGWTRCACGGADRGGSSIHYRDCPAARG